jgi:nitrite reductase/ring-hydroxylating ferredoxin subunit
MGHPVTCTPGPTSAGNKSNFTVGQAQQVGNYIVARDAQGFYGMTAICPHAGCVINDFSTPNQLICDCHGAYWDLNGENGQGPQRAQGSTLQHYVLCIDASGNITITSAKAQVTDRY